MELVNILYVFSSWMMGQSNTEKYGGKNLLWSPYFMPKIVGIILVVL